MFNRKKGITTQPIWHFIGLLATALLAVCVITFGLMVTPAPSQPPLAPTPEPPTPTLTPEPPTPTPEPSTAISSSGGRLAAGTVNLDQIFPPGYQTERDLVMFTCGHCHSWVCAVRGQRTVAHWGTVWSTHRNLFPALSAEELELLFTFLVENYNDTQPEPDIPAELQGLGCTSPFR